MIILFLFQKAFPPLHLPVTCVPLLVVWHSVSSRWPPIILFLFQKAFPPLHLKVVFIIGTSVKNAYHRFMQYKSHLTYLVLQRHSCRRHQIKILDDPLASPHQQVLSDVKKIAIDVKLQKSQLISHILELENFLQANFNARCDVESFQMKVSDKV